MDKVKEEKQMDPEVLYKAKERIGNSRARLLLQQPFYGVLLSMMDFLPECSLPTMATDGAKVYYNPEFTMGLTDDEVYGVLLHEISHCIYLHCTTKRRMNREHQRWNVACFPAGTILPGSFKAINETVIGDAVIGSNGQAQKITNTMVNDYNGPLYTIRASGVLPIQCTEDHPILVAERIGNGYPIKLGQPKWKKAGEVCVKSDYLVVPEISGTDNTTTIDLQHYLAHTKVLNHDQCHNVAKCVKDGITLDEDFAWFMGLYCAEGSKLSSTAGGLSFSLHIKETDYAKKIASMADRLGYKTTTEYRLEQKNMVVKMSSSIVARLFDEHIGQGAKNKRIPSFILYNQNIKLVEAFLTGLLDSDGCQVKDNNNQLSTSSLTLALQTQQAIGRLGYYANVRKHNVKERMFGDQTLPAGIMYVVDWINSTGTPSTMIGHTINSFQNRWKRQGNNYLVPITKVTQEQFIGKVYNVETEDHTYTVSNALVHNCDFAINLEIKDMGYALPATVLLDQKYRDMCAEQIFDALPKDTSQMQTMDMHIENSDENNWDDMEDRIITAYEMTKNQKGKGNTPGGLKRWIDKLRKSKVKWERIFHRYVGQAVSRDDYSYTRVNKRFLGQDIYLPDLRSNIIGNIVVGIDTSGSMGRESLEQIAAELLKMSHLLKEITVITCDTQVNEVIKINQFSDFIKKLHFSGGGGTYLKPIVDKIKEMKSVPEICIMATDGYVEEGWGFEGKKPNFPVLWCMVGENPPKPPFGMVVEIPNDKGSKG